MFNGYNDTSWKAQLRNYSALCLVATYSFFAVTDLIDHDISVADKCIVQMAFGIWVTIILFPGDPFAVCHSEVPNLSVYITPVPELFLWSGICALDLPENSRV